MSKEEYESLKGKTWLFQRDLEELDKLKRERLALLFECALELKRANDMREEPTGVCHKLHLNANAL